MTGLFFTLIKIAVGNLTVSEGLSCAPSAAEWKEALVTANKQTLIGVLLPAVEEVNKVYPVPYEIWMQWNFFSQKIIEKNRKMDQKVIELGEMLEKDGFRYCILKGQGVARYYPRPELRTPGDIDVWMWPENSAGSCLKERRLAVIRYVRKDFPDVRATYHNVRFPIFDNRPEVEAHYTPSWLFSSKRNIRLQLFFEKNATEQFKPNNGIGFNNPDWKFNCIFLLNHVYRHLFEEGIGLRQIFDYYYVLQSHKPSDSERSELQCDMERLGLMKFSQEISYVLKTIFNISDDYLITDVETEGGAFLMNEIMEAGNFGKFDKRTEKLRETAGKTSRAWQRLLHSLSMARRYPEEAMSEMPFRVRQLIWRKLNHLD